MYHHANTNINLQSSDQASISTKSSKTRRRQIPLAFTNTQWGREYIANPDWEQEIHGTGNANTRQESRSPSESNGRSIPASNHNVSTIISANESIDYHSSSSSATTPPSISPAPKQSSQQYSVMVAWNFFRRTLPQSSPTPPDRPDTETKNTIQPQQEEIVVLGPWLDMLMRWDDFEQWQLKVIPHPDASNPL